MLKPHFENLVSSYVFPQLCFTPAKQEQWNTDPIEYARVTIGEYQIICVRLGVEWHDSPDEYESFDTPVSAATSFLLSLASNRTKSTFMPILTFINRVLQSCVSFGLDGTARSLFLIIVHRKPASPQRFGALNMTAALGHFCMRHPEVKGSMEQFLLQHVLPEFTSSEPYMRAIVCFIRFIPACPSPTDRFYRLAKS